MINTIEMQSGLKWLIAFRVVFAIVLVFSTLVFSTNESLPYNAIPFVSVYILSLFMLLISVIYGIFFRRLSSNPLFAYVQLAIDTFSVSAIIFITGGFQSIFTFIYLVIIIASSILLFRKGSLIIATLCSIQYGILIDLEYYGVIKPFVTNGSLSSMVAWNHIIYRLVIMMGACFAVAVLSGFLAVQAKKAKKELKLVEDHLKRVEKMATMGELAAGMAHEIKNPLASLSGAIQMLKDDAEPGTSNYRLMQIVLRETERLTRIVTEFLLFAKPRPLIMKKINLAEEIASTVRLFRKDALCRGDSRKKRESGYFSEASDIYAPPDDGRMASGSRSAVESEDDADLNYEAFTGVKVDKKGVCPDKISFEMKLDKTIQADMAPDHFNQILWNLLKNAAEAVHSRLNSENDDDLEDDIARENTGLSSSEGVKGKIVIRLSRSKDERILLKVSDNGCGIAKSDLDLIFNPFFTTKSYGTGLGLAIIHRLIDLYNGLLYVESEIGKGTTFTVIFRETRKDTSIPDRNKILTLGSKIG